MAMCNQISARPRKSNHRRLSIHPDFIGLPHGRACPADFRGTVLRQMAELSCLPLSCDAQALPQRVRLVLSIARLIGRQMAREDFERLRVANDNDPGTSDAAEDGAEKD